MPNIPKIARIALIIAVFTILAFLSILMRPSQTNPTEAIENRSAYNSKPSGIRAWYLASQKSDIPMEIWGRPFQDLDALPSPANMLIIQPFTMANNTVIYGEQESAQLLHWVGQGNTLVLLDDFRRPGSKALIQKLGTQTRPVALHSSQKKVPPTLATVPSDILSVSPSGQRLRIPRTEGGNSNLSPKDFNYSKMTHSQKTNILDFKLDFKKNSEMGRFMQAAPQSRAEFYFVPFLKKGHQVKKARQADNTVQNADIVLQNAAIILQNRQRQPVCIQLSYQKGRLILGTMTDLVENRQLYQNADDNFQFLSNLVSLEKKPLFINEFVHGYREIQDIFAYLREKTPVGAIFMQLIFVFLLVLWLSFTRWIPVFDPKTTTNAQGLSPFIDSLAGLYYRRQAAEMAIRPQLSRIKTLLRRRYQIELTEQEPLQNLLKNLFTSYPDNDTVSLIAALKKAQTLIADEGFEPQLSHRDLHQLVRQLSIIQAHLEQERLQYVPR